MGRPPKEINWDIVENYMQAGCSNVTALAHKFCVNRNTFYDKFKAYHGCSFQDYRTDARETGLEDLRLMLHAKALNNKAPGNPNVLMFAARCLLGMKEPESVQDTAPKQDDIEKDHLIMRLQHENAELKANANKSQTG